MVAPVRKTNDQQDLFGVVDGLTRDMNLASFERSNISNAAGQNITAAQILGGYIERDGAVTVSDALPTAAAVLALLPGMEVHDCRLLIIRNANTGTLTLTAGTNFTIVGTATIATVTTAVYMMRKTSATALTITRLIAAAY
jgi:hypothetical protein